MANWLHLYDKFKRTPEFIQLTAGQIDFAHAFFQGKNVFLTGAAGVGKSFVVRLIFDFAQANDIPIGKTALTGVAAFNIGGQTLHSFAGLGLAEEDVKTLISLVRKKRKAVERIEKCAVLIIDEVSMMKADLMDKVDLVFKYFRFSERPFGGCQIVCVGDWLQLAPVWKGGESKDFCFNSRAWKEAEIKTVELTEIMRQVNDGPFARSLNQIRVGDAKGLDLIRTRVGATFPAGGTEPVRIFCKNVDVDRLNGDKLRALPGDPKTYHAKDSGETYHTEHFNKNCPAPQTLHLKVGAQVLLCTNVDLSRGLCNGSLGTVKSFTTKGPVVEFQSGPLIVEEAQWEIKEQEPKAKGGFRYRIVATRNQIPLRLAWAMTVHRVQGSTLDRATVDMSEAFATGMAYVALSRVRSIDCLSVVDFPSQRVMVSKECLDFYHALQPSKPAPAAVEEPALF